MESEPDFNRVLAALSCRQPDRVPLGEAGINLKMKEAFLGKSIDSLEDEVEFWQRAGYDYVLLGRKFLDFFPGAEYSRKWMEETKGGIATIKDFEDYAWPDPAKADYSEFEEIGLYLPKGMKVIFFSSPIFQWVWVLMGFETFALASVENPELVIKMLYQVGRIRMQVFDNVLRRCDNLGAVWVSDDIAYGGRLMVAPHLLREHLFPWFKMMKDRCRQRGLPLIYHSDGDFSEVLDDLLALGIDAIHPIEPNGGMGSYTPQLKERFRDRLCLIGGIDLDTLIRGTQKEVERETRRIIKEAAPGGGYVAGSSNSITDRVPLENYRVMLDTTFKYGKYPLNL